MILQLAQAGIVITLLRREYKYIVSPRAPVVVFSVGINYDNLEIVVRKLNAHGGELRQRWHLSATQ